ncbi:serum albumin [Microcaecilia unicolor]|uniref:Serum albumin-like n=1 Tax=Microcaecilia unicolor TaxID=1415580 RepID=A0A6P7X7D0_9AMPH|nr:serum albumin-like [Microcaecilia unicolor]
MKWIALISLVILLSFTESRNLQRRSHEDHAERTIADVYTTLGEEKFKVLAMVTLAQYLQKSSYDDLAHCVRDLTALAQGCKTDPQGQECQKSLTTTYLDTICRHPDLGNNNDGFTECCSETDPDRNKCFLKHKSTDPNFLPPYQRPTSEEACKSMKENRVFTLGQYIYELSRRHPFLQGPFILATAIHYESALKECCLDATKLDECLREKKTIIIKGVKTMDAYQRHSCTVLEMFGTRVLQADKLVQVAQKYPASSMDIWAKLSHDITHLYEDCCHGDMIECAIDRAELTEFVCSNQEKISTKLKECCDLEVGLRGECIIKAEKDAKPEGLSEKVTEFIQDAAVCQRYADEKDKFLASFLVEYARRHQDFPRQMILRAGKGYEALLKECCSQASPVECMAKGEDKLKEGITESLTLLKENCDALHNLGPYHFQNTLIRRYFVKMPQIRSEPLIEMTRHMTKVGELCCEMPEEKKMSCSEEGLSMLISEMCKRQQTIHINDQVSKCCSDSYSEWRPCFSHMGADPTYVPPAITPDMFQFHTDLCSASEKEVQEKKQMLLVQFLKVKPDLTSEQFDAIAPKFLAMVGTCCKELAPEVCFAKEGPEFIKKIKELVGA